MTHAISRKLVLILMLAVMAVTARTVAAEAGPVQSKLDELKIQSDKSVPPEVLEAGRQGTEELIQAGVARKALQVGDHAPPFVLSDAQGKAVKSKALLKKGPMVLVFYRGAWCPFCNLYLRSVQEYLPEISARGASLVAISGENPDNTLTVQQKNALEFSVLSDPGLAVARKFGVVYDLPEVVNQAVLKLGFNLASYYGSEKAELPLSATYVISEIGEIVYAFLDPDYKKRAEPRELLAALDGLKK